MTSDTQTTTVDQLAQRVAELQSQLDELRESSLPQDKLSMVVFSGDLDRQLAAFIIATGAAAMFEEVVMFFTFWATPALRDPAKRPGPKDMMAKMFGWMLPKGAGSLKLSKMHMAGMGTGMMKGLMKKKGVMSLEQLMRQAAESGVKIYVCQMSMELMGFSTDELIDYPDLKVAGVAKFLAEAGTSKTTLFI
ncbi:MAG: NADH dehydrogenase FAD-containing subunit [Chthonomonadales bacterium]|nr:NADH dehydrogenase FAD-containing subunit [Chthonomonadales bacterium]